MKTRNNKPTPIRTEFMGTQKVRGNIPGLQPGVGPNIMARAMNTLAFDMISRSTLSSAFGKTYGDERDVAKALGYPKHGMITFDHYDFRYQRQDIAGRIVDAPVEACWRLKPVLSEGSDEPTPFEKDWEALVKKHRIYHYLAKADRISGVGEYGTLLMGFHDGLEMVEEAVRAKDLLFLRVLNQKNSEIASWDVDVKSERYGHPDVYQVRLATSEYSSASRRVHHTRMIHVAENTGDNDTYGTPRLQKVFNRLIDLDRTVGASAEMFWRAGLPGLMFTLDPEATLTKEAKSDFEDQLNAYTHDLQRWMRLQGITATHLKPDVSSPKEIFEVLIALISAAARIPQRTLIGSEQGKLAADQDSKNWDIYIDARRKDHCELTILRPFIDRLIIVGVLTAPASGEYAVIWPELTSPSQLDAADVASKKTEALSKYVNAPGADLIMPPDFFLAEFMGLTPEQIETINKMLESYEPRDQGEGEREGEGEFEEEEEEE